MSKKDVSSATVSSFRDIADDRKPAVNVQRTPATSLARPLTRLRPGAASAAVTRYAFCRSCCSSLVSSANIMCPLPRYSIVLHRETRNLSRFAETSPPFALALSFPRLSAAFRLLRLVVSEGLCEGQRGSLSRKIAFENDFPEDDSFWEIYTPRYKPQTTETQLINR